MTRPSQDRNRRRAKAKHKARAKRKARHKRRRTPPPQRLLRQVQSTLGALLRRDTTRDQPVLVPQGSTPYWRLIILLEAHGFQRRAIKKRNTAYGSTVHIFRNTALGAMGYLMVDVRDGSVSAGEYTKASHYVQGIQHSGRI